MTIQSIIQYNHKQTCSYLHGKESVSDIIYDIFSTFPDFINIQSLAKTKIARFNTYYDMFPEYTYIFIGDNGQGDVIVGLHILNISNTAIVCIHNIYYNNNYKYNTYDMNNIYSKLNTNKANRLLFFNTYM